MAKTQRSAVALSPRRPADPEPDLTSLVVIHRAMLEDLARLTDVLGQLCGRDIVPVRGRAIGHYASALLTQISHHHQNEDDLVWPVIAATAGQAIDLTPLTDDHAALEPAIARVGRALMVLPDAPGQGMTDLHASVRDLREMLGEHIKDEENQILPVMRRYVRAESYRWCEKQIQQKASLSTLRFAVPWLARFARPDELSRMLAVGGWPVRLLLALTRPRYRRLERRAFGDLADSWRNQ